MKKIVITLAVAAATLFAFSSCQKENLTNTSNDGVRVITATFENDGTKTTLNADGKTPEWAVGDVLRILNGTSYQDVTLAAENITDNKITFTTTLTGTLYAVYPASATAMTSCSDGNVSFTVPAIQDGSFASANICVAKSSTTDETNKDKFVFRNATAVVKITTAADVVGVDVITDNSIAGAVTASFSGSELSLMTTSLDKKYVSAVGTSAPSGNVFYLAAAPVTTGSATVNCYKTDKKGTESKDSKALARNAIYSMDLTSVTIDNPDLTGQRGNLNGHEYVIIKCGDKNLKWATMNIGATSETKFGQYFAWGYAEGCVRNSANNGWVLASDNTTAKSFKTDYFPNRDASSFQDAATANWGGSWRMPTKAEFDALCASTKSWKTNYNGSGVNGYLFGNSIFLPAAGYGYYVGFEGGYGENGYYWSSAPDSAGKAYCLSLQSGSAGTASVNRYFGLPVRALSD